MTILIPIMFLWFSFHQEQITSTQIPFGDQGQNKFGYSSQLEEDCESVALKGLQSSPKRSQIGPKIRQNTGEFFVCSWFVNMYLYIYMDKAPGAHSGKPVLSQVEVFFSGSRPWSLSGSQDPVEHFLLFPRFFCGFYSLLALLFNTKCLFFWFFSRVMQHVQIVLLCGRQHDFSCFKGVCPGLFWCIAFAFVLIPFLWGYFA